MAENPLPLDEFCWPPNGSTEAGPISYGPDGSIIVGSNYGDTVFEGDTGFELNVQGDDFNLQQTNYNDSIIQNFEIVRETLNNTITFINDNSTNIGPVNSFFNTTQNFNTNVTNMGDIDMGNLVTRTDIDMRDFSTNINNVQGGPPGTYSPPSMGASIGIALTKSPVTGAVASNDFVPGSGIASLLYRLNPDINPASAAANLNYANKCRECSGKEQDLGRGHPEVIECWVVANNLNPYGVGDVVGASASTYEEPQGGLGNIDPQMGYGPNAAQNIAQGGGSVLGAANANDPDMIARQKIVTVFNLSPCIIEANKLVLLARETEHRFWVIAEACDVCP